jgi:dethiobiotin synthetase
MKKNPLAFFITGTDTEIGKTLVSCAILHTMVQNGWQSVGMKPVAAGAEMMDGELHNEDVVALTAVSNVRPVANLVNPYLFKLAAAPHVAAEQEQRHIKLELIIESYQQLTERAEAIVVEGVGGFQVPFNATEDSADMAQLLNLPVILVVGMRLGCINHALLSAEAIAARGLKLAGWVANSAQTEMAYLQENLTALRERLKAPCLGCIPFLNTPDPAVAAGYLDLTALIKKSN